jgi:WD40 repeat protein
MSDKIIVSGSGDRSMKVWDAETGELLQSYENYHERGYASPAVVLFSAHICVFRLAAIDFQAPYVLSGSSDKQLRLVDITTGQGWSTSPVIEELAGPQPPRGAVCRTCGSIPQANPSRGVPQTMHEDLVRSVVLNSDFVVSGSYDHTVKVSSIADIAIY